MLTPDRLIFSDPLAGATTERVQAVAKRLLANEDKLTPVLAARVPLLPA